ncbi:unnamed protein product [Cladocopium goreaui]|uniref:Membrane fusion protein biotin-lipoyl like domain-containing protein n=1 Tax=Cladocopium goreaui TaxID=2562237 RepID=A0A9P1CWV9_9DINO|nr:unnamed protein product [Cladocopium goreaui]
MTEVDRFLDDLDRLAATADPGAPGDFYGDLLPTAAAALGADAADYTPLPGSGVQDVAPAAWPTDRVAQEALLSDERVARLGAEGAPRIVTAASERSDAGPVIACPVHGATGAQGVLAFRLGFEAIASAERRLQLASAVGEVAERYELRRAAADLKAGEERLRRVEALLLRLHSRRGLPAIAREAAEEGRRLVGCDRLSVFQRRGSSWRALAASGVNRLSHRSDATRQMRQLVATAAKLGEPLVVPSDETLLPQVSREVDQYLDASGVRSLCVWPCPSSPDDDSASHAEEVALLAEWFGHRNDTSALATLAAIGRHVGVAASRARVGGWSGRLRNAGVRLALAAVAIVGATFVAMTPATLWVPVDGRFEPVDHARVFASMDGVVEEVLVKQSDRVTAGQPLVRMASPDLKVRREEVAESIAMTRAELDGLSTAQLRAALPGQDEPTDRTALASRAAALRERLEHQLAQQALLDEQAEELLVLSPIDGLIVSWRPQDYLSDRPVRRGERLLEVAGDQRWRLELEAPDHRSGHLLEAQSEGLPLDVEYVVRADPATTRLARVVSIAEATRANAEGVPVVRVVASPDEDAALSARSGLGRSKRFNAAGSSADALRVACFFALCAIGPVASAADREPIVVRSSILTVAEAVAVPAPQSGVLLELNVREGATLSAGQSIAQIDAREQRLHAELVRQDLAIARRESESDVRVRLAAKENKVAEAELGRATQVNATLPNTVSAKEVDRLRLAVERTELEIEHAAFEREMLAAKMKRIEADLRLAEHRVERLAIAASIGGVVAETPHRAGEWVKEGETIARLVRVDALRVEGYVRVEDALQGLVGRPVEVEAPLPGGEVLRARGRVVFVSPEAEPVDAKVRFWAEVDNGELKLRPGLTARVVIAGESADEAASVAASDR